MNWLYGFRIFISGDDIFPNNLYTGRKIGIYTWNNTSWNYEPFPYDAPNTFQINIIENGVEITGLKSDFDGGEIRIPPQIQGKPVTTIGYNAFHAHGLLNVTIPDSVTDIRYQAFVDNQLSCVTIPDSVITIEERAFENNNLSNIVIGKSVTTIEHMAFAHNPLTNVTINSDISSFSKTAFDYNSISKNLLAIFISQLSRKEKIGTYIWDGNAWNKK